MPTARTVEQILAHRRTPDAVGPRRALSRKSDPVAGLECGSTSGASLGPAALIHYRRGQRSTLMSLVTLRILAVDVDRLELKLC